MHKLKYYYIVENGQQSGPFTVEDLQSKMLKKNTLVWTDGLTNWVSAESMDELKDLLIVEPPPVNPIPSPPNVPQSQNTLPQQAFSFDKYFRSDSGGILIGIFCVILFSLLDWVNIYSLKFNLFGLSNELNSSFFREFFSGSDEIMLLRIAVVILMIALVLSFALLIISLLKPQLKSKQALAYCGFGLSAIVAAIFIIAVIYIYMDIDYWIMTVFPFLTLGSAIVSMIFFVKRPEKIDLSYIASELRG